MVGLQGLGFVVPQTRTIPSLKVYKPGNKDDPRMEHSGALNLKELPGGLSVDKIAHDSLHDKCVIVNNPAHVPLCLQCCMRVRVMQGFGQSRTCPFKAL